MANRILIGNRATGGYGLYVSRSGEDVATCNKSDLYFWTENEESGSNFVGYGPLQVVPISGGATSAPVESATVDLSGSTTSASVSFQDLVADGDDVLIFGGTTAANTSSQNNAWSGVKFTSPSATGATANRSHSTTGGTFTVFVFKRLNNGAALT